MTGFRIAAAALLLVCAAACSSRPPVPSGRTLRVVLDVPPGLTTCRFAPVERRVVERAKTHYRAETRVLERAISVELGAAAIEYTTAALGTTFMLVSDDADLVARPRIAAAAVDRDPDARGLSASLTYTLDFHTPAGQAVATVSGSGRGHFQYPLLVDLARLVFHIGTLTLFDEAEANQVYRTAFGRAAESAGDDLAAAIADARGLREYAATMHAGRQPTGRDAELDRLLETVLARRPASVAVLDLEPIVDAPTLAEAYLAEEIRTRLARRGVQTVERAALVRALEELQLNMTDLVDPTHAQRFGRLMAADAILTGTTVRFPHEMKLTLRLLGTESGQVIGAGGIRLSTHGEFPDAGGAPLAAARAPACPAPAGPIWVGGPPAMPTPARQQWRAY